ncbi:uncharacterized protein BDW43DRAFT_86537 [Aspergillus alliaceus]|uniref:uncharacterized protein n=1 Tax=Petromyces alliaceus TaxID=209559 RepID=UPI0012A56238|nr:uncharacterized protein BDW43DRAFT_86537 [Aspergillus alliaceus]KAB8233391.1 hypothetical protein BDW43DRAFT_86537 [Aspergillus alliaceus]
MHPVRNGHIRRLMINSCINQRLALSIIHAIASAKQRRPSPVNKLTIRVCGKGVSRDFESLVDMFSARWVVERDPCPDHRKDIRATESHISERTGKRRREHLQPWLEKNFYRIWPKYRRQLRESQVKSSSRRGKRREEATSVWWRH